MNTKNITKEQLIDKINFLNNQIKELNISNKKTQKIDAVPRLFDEKFPLFLNTVASLVMVLNSECKVVRFNRAC